MDSISNVISRCGAADVDHAVAAARRAQPDWAAVSADERARILRRVEDLFAESAEEIARVICAEIGKTISDAREEAFEHAAPAYGIAAAEVVHHAGLSLPSTDEIDSKRLVLGHRPLGVVGAITPSDFPVGVSSVALAQIVAAGNTAVWKPSDRAPASAALMAELFERAGLPPGVVNVIEGFGDVGVAIAAHDQVDGVFFAGLAARGEELARAAGLKPRLLRLSGDRSFIVLDDASVDAAVDAASDACFYCAGQVSTSAERLFVHAAVHEEFVEKLKARASALRIGDPAAEETEMGPLRDESALQRVERHVEDARAKGAEVAQFGPREDLYYPATVLTGASEEMLIMQEETFGPVAPVAEIASAQEAVEIASRTERGLAASLWTRDLATAWRFGEALPHGTVNVNEASNHRDQLTPLIGLDSFTERKLLTFELGDAALGNGRRAF